MVIWFASGAAALIYQVLWVRGLGLLFGSTAEAAAITIAIFFAGMMAGGAYWGRRAPDLRSALRVFGLVELGVAATALGHFLLLDVYHGLYAALYSVVGQQPSLETFGKAVVAAVILLPPAFLMGGTLPLIGQHLVRRRDQLGTKGSLLYAVNSAGGAVGALAAGFFLPLALGLAGAYLLAVGVDVAVGVTAILLAPILGGAVTASGPEPQPSPAPQPSRAERAKRATRAASPAPTLGPPLDLSPGIIWLVAFFSGVATLGIEVLWTRLFSQVLQNSAYTYSLVLASFLVGLALGAAAANGLSRVTRPSPIQILSILLATSALVAVASPWLFHDVTGGFRYLGSGNGWYGYVMDVMGLAVIVVLGPTVILGAVLPYLLRALQGTSREPGEIIGRLVAVNTAGAMVGSLAVGFVLLPAFGASRSLLMIAALYAALCAVVIARSFAGASRALAIPSALAAVGFLVAPVDGLRGVTIDAAAGERLVELREGTAAHVSVVEDDGALLLKVNNHYTLGGTGTMQYERNQAIIPMLTHPAPKSVFFLGLGTGLSTGASLYFPVDRVVACELLPEVIDLSREHFEPWLNGLFEDSRVTIHAEDGRNCLRRSSDTYDVIISDLFTPWHAGTGNLYTVEHYRTVLERLEPGGIFAQWVPLYQVTEVELGIIARTMAEVFPQVVLWRGDFSTERSIVALLGQAEPTPLDPDVLVRNVREIGDDPRIPTEYAEQLTLPFYAGNIGLSGLFADRPLNTDDYPLIEYLAPRSYRAVVSGDAEWLVGERRDSLLMRIREAVPPAEDPYLTRLTPEQLELVGHQGQG